MSFNTIQYKRIGLHIVFWIAIISYSTFFFGYPDKIKEWFLLTLYILPVDITFVYITLYILIPRFLLKKKYFLFTVLFFLIGYIDELIIRTVYAEFIYMKPYTATYIFWGSGVWDLFSNYYFAIVAAIIKIVRIWFKKSKEAQKITKEKYESDLKLKDAELKLKDAELKLLKAQVHPHFLFNTLNNLYGLTLENSKKAPEVVIKLSALLDYVLYKCNTPTVSLTNEIAQIINYIDLEKLRYDDSLTISLNQNGNAENKEIAPLLLLPFIENCFKHGVSKNSGSSWIKIIIEIIDNEFIFIAENNKSSLQNKSKIRYSEGIGLKNVKQRLELAYKGNYNLIIDDSENLFSVYLKIKL